MENLRKQQKSVLYAGHNIVSLTKKVHKTMDKYVLDPLSGAQALTALVLRKADRAFYRMRRSKERQYKLSNGTIHGV